MRYIEVFEKMVTEYPQKNIIHAYGNKISYYDLNCKSNYMAVQLKNLLSESENKVAIFSDASIEHFIAMLACIKCGIEFINIDVNAPSNYIKSVCRQLNISIYLFTGKYREMVKNEINAYSIESLSQSTLDKYDFVNKSRLGYYIATSGTTGIPKLVRKSELSLMNSYSQMRQEVPIMFNARIQQTATLSFAFGLDQSLIMLLASTEIFINDREKYFDINILFAYAESNFVDTLFLPTPIIKLLSRQPFLLEGVPECIKNIVVGGESLLISADLIFALRNHDIDLYNNYGTTETGTICFNKVHFSIFHVEKYNRVPIGHPLKTIDFLVLQEQGASMVQTNKGMLFVGTHNIGNTYLSESEYEGKLIKFKGNEYYPTGDIVENIKGTLYIVGRKDNCVNIRGYKVELENVEKIISKVIEGKECCVISVENSLKEKMLVCFYEIGKVDNEQLKVKLAQELPDYMIPMVFIPTNNFAYTKSGKIDRNKMTRIYDRQKALEDKGFNNSLILRLRHPIEKMIGVKLDEKHNDVLFKDLGLDSMSFVDYICVVEHNENVVIEDSALGSEQINTISKLAKYIESRKDSDGNTL